MPDTVHRGPIRALAVMICTRDRLRLLEPMLTALRVSIDALAAGRHIPATVVIADNSPAGQQADIEALAARAGLAIRYVHEPRAGYATVRNSALEAALTSGGDVLVFLDDDDLPRPDLLSEHIAVLTDNGLDVVYGGEAGKTRKSRALTFKVATNNVAFRSWIVREAGLRFDERFNFIGYEDYAFFGAAHKHGARMMSSNRPQVVRGAQPKEAPLNVRLAVARADGRNRIVMTRLLYGEPRAFLRMVFYVLSNTLAALGSTLGLRTKQPAAVLKQRALGALETVWRHKGLSRQAAKRGEFEEVG